MYQFRAKGGFGMMHQATKRRVDEAQVKKPKPPVMKDAGVLRSGVTFKIRDQQIGGFWVGVETGPSATRPGDSYFNGWVYLPELGKKAWQQIGFPEKTEQAALKSVETYIQKQK